MLDNEKNNLSAINQPELRFGEVFNNQLKIPYIRRLKELSCVNKIKTTYVWVHRACYAWLKLDCRPSDAVKDEIATLSKIDFSQTNPCSFCNDTCSLVGNKRQSFKIKCGGVQGYPLIRHGRVW